MDWKNNPNYSVARKECIQGLSGRQLENLHFSLPKVVFICGGDEKYCKNRGKVEEYFKKNLPKFLTFRAEDAWNVIQKNSKKYNALDLEDWLADLSDIVIIIVESFGTVAELGAFSMNENLRNKLLPILDMQYENDPSFINTGPIKSINDDSKYSPAIYTDFETILTCMNQVEERVARKHWDVLYRSQLFGKYRYSNKVFLFYYIYLLASLGPIDIEEIIEVTRAMLEFDDKKHIQFIISIGVALKIFKESNIEGHLYYSCIDYKKLFHSSETKKHLSRIQKIRTKNLFSLLKIGSYKEILEKVISYD